MKSVLSLIFLTLYTLGVNADSLSAVSADYYDAWLTRRLEDETSNTTE